MALPHEDTVITYPQGATDSASTVIHVEELPDGRCAVLLDRTACHPVDAAWPDQPADYGILQTTHGPIHIADAVTTGIHEGRLYLGQDLPVRIGTPKWTFAVAHIVNTTPPAVGEVVRVEIDQKRRQSISAAHTACHLAALALDEAVTDQWTKPAQLGPLGHPSFDALALQKSRIQPGKSHETYRIGKSLRRKGFPVTGFQDTALITQRINARLAQWVAAEAPVHIVADSNMLSSRRLWECILPDGTVTIPCGGTHLTNTAELARVSVEFEVSDVTGGVEIQMTTYATLREDRC